MTKRLILFVIAALCLGIFMSCAPWSSSDDSEVAGRTVTVVGDDEDDGSAGSPSDDDTSRDDQDDDEPAPAGGGAPAQAAAVDDEDQDDDENEPATGTKPPRGSSGPLGVTLGGVETLYPGISRTVPITFTNPRAFPIEVRSATATVEVLGSRAAICPPSELVVTPPPISRATPVPIAARGTASSSFEVRLSADAPDGCQDVPFVLTLSAVGRKS